jgi:hypothetical protein
MPKIEDKELYMQHHYLDKVTYIPSHANGDACHKDSKQGVIISFTPDNVKVLYCEGRTVQSTRPEDLVWG